MGDFSFDCAECELPVVGDTIREELQPFSRVVQINEANETNRGTYDHYGRLTEDMFAFVMKGREDVDPDADHRRQFFDAYDENMEDMKVVHELCFEESMRFEDLPNSPSGQEYLRVHSQGRDSRAPFQTGMYVRHLMNQYLESGEKPLDCRSDGIRWDELDDLGSALFHHTDQFKDREGLNEFIHDSVIPALADHKNKNPEDRPFGRYYPDKDDLREGFETIGMDVPESLIEEDPSGGPSP